MVRSIIFGDDDNDEKPSLLQNILFDKQDRHVCLYDIRMAHAISGVDDV